MCGIAGFLRSDGRPAGLEDDREILGSMCHSLRHRGPDDSGTEISDQVGLAFARLSIIDLESGHQPMVSAKGNLALVFNGEIYNFEELRAQLRARGHQFRTRSDTEVVLAAYEEYGAEMVEHLNGMFAIAVHDRAERTLFLARDRVGIKPLYYSQTPTRFVFGSEIKAVLCDGSVDRGIDADALNDYLSFRVVPAPRTIHRSIRALRPGHCLHVDARGTVTERCYWEVSRVDVPSHPVEAREELERLLRSAVKMRMVADVPLGALLSGGVDSGLVVALMSQAASGPVKTFSVGFEEEPFDELSGAARVAERYGTDHTEIVCRPDVHELVLRLVEAFDQPFGDASAIPTFLVCETARRSVTVALSGDGGDETFAGYTRHSAFVRRSGSGPVTPIVRGLASTIGRVIPPTLRGAQRLRRMGLKDRDYQVDSVMMSEARIKASLAGPRLEAETDVHSSWRLGLDAGGVFESEGGLRRFQHQDLSLYLSNDVLTKVDVTSMMNSLEVRVPLLDYRLVQFGLNLDPALKNNGTNGKLLLREVARDLLPEGHLDRPKKGFSIPADQWLRSELRDLVRGNLESSQLARDGWLNQSGLDRMVAEQMGGRSWSPVLWPLLMLELWFRNANRNPSVAAATATR